MPIVAVLNLGTQQAEAVVANVSSTGIVLLRRFVLAYPSTTEAPSEPTADEASSSEPTEAQEDLAKKEAAEELIQEDSLSRQTTSLPLLGFSELIGIEPDYILAVLESSRMLLLTTTLPFKDTRKIEQVLPLQLQDILPFDLNKFLLDFLILGETGDGSYNLLVAIVPREDVVAAIKQAQSLGVEPKHLTIKSMALLGLKELLAKQFQGDYCIAQVSEEIASLGLFVGGQLRAARELSGNFQDLYGAGFRALSRDIRSSIVRVEHDEELTFDRFYAVSSSQTAIRLSEQAARNFEILDPSQFVTFDSGFEGIPEDAFWAVGFFALPLSSHSRGKLINFRRGDLAYRPAWGNFVSAIHEELQYILLAVFLGLAWLGTLVYSNHIRLNKIEAAIQQEVQTALPNQTLPKGREVIELTNKLGNIEEQLRELGSLSSLSPLESLRELSLAVSRDIDLKIDTLSIADGAVSFSGSVADSPAVGRLSTALENRRDRFCKVQVDPKGRMPGASTRVKFDADLSFCP